MCRTVASHQSRAVYRKHDMQLLLAHVVENLVISSLQERRIDCHHRHQSCLRKSCSKGHSVSLRNSHVKEPVGIQPCKTRKPGSIRHGRCDCHKLRLSLPQFLHHSRKDICIIGLRTPGEQLSGLNIKGLCAVKSGGMLLSRQIPIAFFRDHMNEHRSPHTLRLGKRLAHRLDVAAVHRSEINDSHLLKVHARNQKLLDSALGIANPFYHSLAVHRNPVQGIHDIQLQVHIGIRRPEIAQITVHTAHIFRNGHIIVIQNDNKICFHIRGIVQTLEGHSSGQCSVADDRHYRVVLPRDLSCLSQSKPGRNRCRAVPRIKAVRSTLTALRKTADSSELPKRRKRFFSSGQNLVGVGLMSDIPDNLILRQCKGQMQCHGKLDHTQI